jgi:hypothetical protein
VAEGVVHLLEAVEVEDDERDRAAGQMRLLLDLTDTRLERGAVQKAREGVEDRPVAVLELALRQGGRDRGHAYQQGDRRDQAGGVVHDSLGVDPEGHAGHGGGGQSRPGHHDRWAEARGRHGDRQDHPWQGWAVLSAAQGGAGRKDGQDQQLRLRREQLGARGGAHPALECQQRHGNDSEQDQEPPAHEWRGGHE